MNLAIVGCGGIGRLHAEMATRAGLKIVACTDKDPDAAKALGRQYNASASTDMDGVIRRPDVDIVLVTTPTPRHSGAVTDAAKAGKHIFCEKPFASTVQQCRAAIAAAKKARVKLFVGHVVRYFHEFETIRAEIRAGKIGTPGFARLYRGGFYPGGPTSWFRDYAQSGGVTFDCMIHDLDWVRYMFGEPERIFCQALRRSEPEKLDYSQVTMKMKNGMLALVIGTWAHPAGFQVKVEVCGSGGAIQFDSKVSSLSAMKREVKGAAPTMVVPSSAEDVSPYQLEWEDFIGWIEGKHEPRVTAEDAVRAVEIALAALKSADTGKPVEL